MTANLNENPSGCEYQLNSTVQETSGGTEKRRRKTNRNRKSQRVGDQENIKQKKNKRSRQVFSVMEGVYSRI